MPSPKPGLAADWCTGGVVGADIVQPPNNPYLTGTGWAVAEEPPREYFNWWWNLVGKWTDYLDDFEAHPLTWSALQTFAAGLALGAPITVNGGVGLTLVLDLVGPSYHQRVYQHVYSGAAPTHSRFLLTHNAAWNGGTSKWVADTSLTGSMKVEVSSAVQKWVVTAKAAFAAPWDDFSWDSQVYLNPAGTTDVDDAAKKSYVDAGDAAATAAARAAPSILGGSISDAGAAVIGVQNYLPFGWASAMTGLNNINGVGTTGAGVLRHLNVSWTNLVGGNVEVQVFVNRPGTGIVATGIITTIAPGGSGFGGDAAHSFATLDGDYVAIGFKMLAGWASGPVPLVASVEWSRA